MKKETALLFYTKIDWHYELFQAHLIPELEFKNLQELLQLHQEKILKTFNNNKVVSFEILKDNLFKIEFNNGFIDKDNYIEILKDITLQQFKEKIKGSNRYKIIRKWIF